MHLTSTRIDGCRTMFSKAILASPLAPTSPLALCAFAYAFSKAFRQAPQRQKELWNRAATQRQAASANVESSSVMASAMLPASSSMFYIFVHGCSASLRCRLQGSREVHQKIGRSRVRPRPSRNLSLGLPMVLQDDQSMEWLGFDGQIQKGDLAERLRSAAFSLKNLSQGHGNHGISWHLCTGGTHPEPTGNLTRTEHQIQVVCSPSVLALLNPGSTSSGFGLKDNHQCLQEAKANVDGFGRRFTSFCNSHSPGKLEPQETLHRSSLQKTWGLILQNTGADYILLHR